MLWPIFVNFMFILHMAPTNFFYFFLFLHNGPQENLPSSALGPSALGSSGRPISATKL